jgi:uncharacterized protein (TIGR02678 family)
MADAYGDEERRQSVRALLLRPLLCAEQDRDTFTLVRRHRAEIDAILTRRLGYRVHVNADTARLVKTGIPWGDRRLEHRDRKLSQREHVVLALTLAAVASGPLVISLADLVPDIRSAAAEAGVELVMDGPGRRAVVTALRWMIDHGLVLEVDQKVDAFGADESADAVLRLRPDRIALLATAALPGAASADELIERATSGSNVRIALRRRLVEEAVVHRADLNEADWSELRRRLGEEAVVLDDEFGLRLESRAEGVAAIDPDGTLSSPRFPTSGTVGHAALLLIEQLTRDQTTEAASWPDVNNAVRRLVDAHGQHWAKDLVSAPDRLRDAAVGLLEAMRLVTIADHGVTVRAAAHRYRPVIDVVDSEQSELW